MLSSLPVALISHQGQGFAFQVSIPRGQDVQRLHVVDLSNAESQRSAFDVDVPQNAKSVFVAMPGYMQDGAFIGISALDSQGQTIVIQQNRITWQSDQTEPFIDPAKIDYSLRNNVIHIVGNARAVETCADLTIRIKNFSPEIKDEYSAKSQNHPALDISEGWTANDQLKLQGLFEKYEPYSRTEQLLDKIQKQSVSDLFDLLLLLEKQQKITATQYGRAGDGVIDRYAVELLGRSIHSDCFEVIETYVAHADQNGSFEIDLPAKGSGPFVLEFDVQSAPFPEYFPCQVIPKRISQALSMTITIPNVSCS